MDLGWYVVLVYFVALTVGLILFVGYQVYCNGPLPPSRMDPVTYEWGIVGPDWDC